MDKTCVGVLGATSFVGDELLPQLRKTCDVTEVSRRAPIATSIEKAASSSIPCWISLIPLAALPAYFDMLTSRSAKKVVALSSTSVFTKANSSDPIERAFVDRLRDGEAKFITWAESQDIKWVILRPTLIYGRGRDRNVSDIARFIRRFGLFPILGSGKGLRQPIHVEDVVRACMSALEAEHIFNCSYNISGGEILNYREMVSRIFQALERRPRLITMPLWGFKAGVACVRILPRFRDLSAAMAERMNADLTFDRSAAERDLGLSKRPFQLGIKDLP
jgi:nucleoside-diphosphate-sugar epimerase